MSSRREAGFTIIEAVVAVAVIAIGILLLSYLFDSIKLTRIAQNETVAVNFARRYLDVNKALWQDPYFYGTRSMPQLTAPSNFKYTIQVEDETFTGGTAIAPVAQTSSVGTVLERSVLLLVTTPDNNVVRLGTRIARPFVNQPPTTSGTGAVGGS